MRKQKLLSAILVTVMVSSLVACGNTPSTSENQAPVTGGTAVPAVQEYEASVDFEDGNFAFAGYNSKIVGGTGESTLSVVDYNGSKALKAESTGKNICVALQADALLGDAVSDVKTVKVTLGVDNPSGTFQAVSGFFYAMCDGTSVKVDSYSIYRENANPKTVEFTIPDGNTLTSCVGISIETDNANDGTQRSNLYIDNVAFLDASGNVIAADTSAVFEAEDAGEDPNLVGMTDVVELDGFAVSAGGWAQAGIDLTDEQRALLVPGSVIEIEYSCDEPVWLVAIGENPLGGWLRGIDQDTFVPDANISADGTKIQYTYEALVAFWGEDFGQYVGTLQCEGKSDWEVYSVKIGKANNYKALTNATELDGFAVSAGGWAQAGIDLTDEQRALLVPGSVIEIEYSCDEPVWLVAIGENPLGGWLRGIDQDTFIPDASISPDGTKIQYTYEALVAFWGEDFGQYVGTLQCEGKSDWQVYSVKIGKAPYKPLKNAVELDGFAVSAGGWSQAGIDLTDEQRALLVPGSVIEIEYSCEEPVWLVAIGENPLGGWLRGIDQDGDPNPFVPNASISADGTKIQYTYEALVAYWGEDFGQYVGTLQCEGKSDWQVYSVTIGTR